MRRVVLCAMFAAAAAQACGPARERPARAQASEEWIRSYPLDLNGRVVVLNHPGPVDVEAVDGRSVEVRATKTAHAPGEAVARELLPRFSIQETITPAEVTVQTGRLGGSPEGPNFIIGVSTEVAYQVKVPRDAGLRVRTGGGQLRVRGVGGRVTLTNSSGEIVATGLAGGVSVRNTNGNVAIGLAALGGDPVEVRVTNGRLHVTLPATANANLSATATNGVVELKGVSLMPFGEQSARRVKGRLNSGGTPIDLAVTNGRLTVEGAAK